MLRNPMYGDMRRGEGKFREDKHLQVPGTMVCHCNKCPGRWWSPHLQGSSRLGEKEARPTR